MIKYEFSEEEIEACEDFGWQIASKHPHFKDKRNTAKRSLEHTASDVTRGKLAEVAVFQTISLEEPDFDVQPPDFNLYPKGVADQGDIFCNGLNISIKSSKPIGNCLLIEKERFEFVNGKPISIDHSPLPDFFVFVKVDEVEKEATICGMVTFEQFWEKKTFLPRGMKINYSNAKKAMIEKIPPSKLPSDRGVPLLADNYGLHIEQLNPFTLNVFQRELLKNA